MNALWAVYKRELNLLFRGTIAYAITFGLMLFLGVIFSASLTQFVTDNQSGFFQPVPADPVVIGMLGTFVFLLFVVAPLLTMRLLSEEAREGTLEVLMTLPMSDWAFVIGKFMAVWTFYTFMLLLTLIHFFMVQQVGVPDAGRAFAAYIGAWLYGGAALAIAMIWSALSEDQIVAAFLGAASILVFFLADGLSLLAGQSLAAGAGDFLRELGLQTHYQQTMLQGIIRAEDIAYFIFLIAAALFLTTLFIGTRRWRAR